MINMYRLLVETEVWPLLPLALTARILVNPDVGKARVMPYDAQIPADHKRKESQVIQDAEWLPGVTLLIFMLAAVRVNAGEGNAAAFRQELVAAALQRTTQQVRYNGTCQNIAYPNGDVAADIGVCTDVVIRSYCALGVDLQQLVHEDMVADFAAYPSRRIWGMTRTDTNIDHRRVPNLQAFFSVMARNELSVITRPIISRGIW